MGKPRLGLSGIESQFRDGERRNGLSAGTWTMPWSKRGYYCRRVYQAGKRRDVYFGRGPQAELAALVDAEYSQFRIADRGHCRSERQQRAEVDAAVEEVSRAAQRLTD